MESPEKIRGIAVSTIFPTYRPEENGCIRKIKMDSTGLSLTSIIIRNATRIAASIATAVRRILNVFSLFMPIHRLSYLLWPMPLNPQHEKPQFFFIQPFRALKKRYDFPFIHHCKHIGQL